MTRNSTFLLYLAASILMVGYLDKQQRQKQPAVTAITDSIRHPAQTKRLIKITNAPGDPSPDGIEIPVAPETQGYAPTSIKDFEAGDPTTGISMISPPAANSLGSAVFSFNMNLPKGRQKMNPLVSIVYNNEGGSSWMGTGWNLTTPAIGIDTRWGVPRYDAGLETEMYLLNGEQLAPVNNRDTFVARTAEKRFYKRAEHDFNKIIRHGNSPLNYWWEVAEKDGTKNYYGGSPATGVLNSAVLKDDNGNIAYLGTGREP